VSDIIAVRTYAPFTFESIHTAKEVAVQRARITAPTRRHRSAGHTSPPREATSGATGRATWLKEMAAMTTNNHRDVPERSTGKDDGVPLWHVVMLADVPTKGDKPVFDP